MIVCSICGTRYEDVFHQETNQAYGCASDVGERDGKWFIISHYGSRHDTSKFDFVRGVQGNGQLRELRKRDTICDDCIDRLKANGELVEDTAYNYFDRHMPG